LILVLLPRQLAARESLAAAERKFFPFRAWFSAFRILRPVTHETFLQQDGIIAKAVDLSIVAQSSI
jgi:hypothetical protein